MTLIVPQNTALIIVDVQNDFCPGGKLPVNEGDQIIAGINKIKEEFGLVVITQDWHPEGHSSFASTHDGRNPFDLVWLKDGQIVGDVEEDKSSPEHAPVEGAIVQRLWPDHCVQGTQGAEFHPGLNIVQTDQILQKGKNPSVDSYSGFFENDGVSRPRFSDGSSLTDVLLSRGISRVVLTGLARDYCVGWHGLDARKEEFDVVFVNDLTRAIAAPVAEGITTETLMNDQLLNAGVQIVNLDGLQDALRPPQSGFQQEVEYVV